MSTLFNLFVSEGRKAAGGSIMQGLSLQINLKSPTRKGLSWELPNFTQHHEHHLWPGICWSMAVSYQSRPVDLANTVAKMDELNEQKWSRLMKRGKMCCFMLLFSNENSIHASVDEVMTEHVMCLVLEVGENNAPLLGILWRKKKNVNLLFGEPCMVLLKPSHPNHKTDIFCTHVYKHTQTDSSHRSNKSQGQLCDNDLTVC